MSTYEDEGDVIRTFTRKFQDAYLERSQHIIIPSVQNKSAQSHFYRIIDLMDSPRGDVTPPHVISGELVLTLLQCAGRLYESNAEEATDLIKCKEFQAILSVGIQDKLAQAIHDQRIESTRSEGLTAETGINASLTSEERKNNARQLDNKATLIEHIASLCYSRPDTLQNFCESARIDETFMFRNYTTLVDALSLSEKSYLATLLPHIFQWVEGAYEETNISYKLVAAYGVPLPQLVIPNSQTEADPTFCDDNIPSNYGSETSQCSSLNFDWGFLDEDDDIFQLSPEPCDNKLTDKLVSPPRSHNTGMVTKKLQDRITPAITQSTQAAFTLVNASKAVIDKAGKPVPATSRSLDAQVKGELLQLFSNMRLGLGNAYSVEQKMLQLFNDPLPTQGWVKALQNSTIEYHTLATVAIFISVLKTAIETSEGEGRKRQQTLSTVPEESQEQTDAEDNKAVQAEIKTTDLSF